MQNQRLQISNSTKVSKPTNFVGETFDFDFDKEYSQQNFDYYINDEHRFEDLIKFSYEGVLGEKKIRWTAWRVFLGLIPHGSEEKIKASVTKERELYYKEFDRNVNIRSSANKDVIDDPLSKHTSNPWNSFFEDNQLKQTIQQDVDRTYQDKDLFLNPKIKELLTNVLFVWSKINSTISYRQGMNEIAGLLAYACFTENAVFVKNKDEISDLYMFLNDAEHAEADIYAVYSKIMDLGQKDMFNPNPVSAKYVINSLNKKKGLDRIFGSSMGEATRPKSALIVRSAVIQENYLEAIDEQLYTHLKKLTVEPQVYLLRWIRCMLNREFRMSDALILWDAIFAFYFQNKSEHKTLQMIDYICLGMIQFIRHDLLMKDDSSLCYARLMKYPPVENVATIISLALKCKASLNNQGTELDNFQKQDFLNRSNSNIGTEEPIKDSGNGNKKKDVILFAPGFAKKTTKSSKEKEISPKNLLQKSQNEASTNTINPLKASNNSDSKPSKPIESKPIESKPADSRPILAIASANSVSSSTSQNPRKNSNNMKIENFNESGVNSKNTHIYSKLIEVLDLLKKDQSSQSTTNLSTAIQELTNAKELFYTAHIEPNNTRK